MADAPTASSLETAVSLHRSGALQEAEDAYRQLLDKEPDNANAVHGLGGVLAERREFAEAAPFLRRATELAPANAAFRHSLARFLAVTGDTAGAETEFRTAVKLEPGFAAAWNSLGELLGNAGRMGEAVRVFERAVGVAPDLAPALFNLGLGLQALGQHQAATGVFEKLLRLVPDHSQALFRLGQIHMVERRFARAATVFVRLTEVKPQHEAAHTSLGAALQLLGNYDAAAECYRKAIELNPTSADAYSNLGTIDQGMRRYEAAMENFQNALRIDPGHSDAVAGVAALLDWQGKYDEGLAWLEPHVRRGDDNVEIAVIYARLLRRAERQREAVDFLEERLERDATTAAARTRFHFLLGDLCDDLGEYDTAFSHYETANRQKPKHFDPQKHREATDCLVRVFTRENLDEFPKLSRGDDRLVFIVGMPRSGTSLVEQILSSHPAVHGAGELDELAKLAAGLPQRLGVAGAYPEIMTQTDVGALDALASEYLERFSGLDESITRITDKTPDNFVHLGLIELVFPGARIVHCKRHPLDTALSNYFQNFAGLGIPFAYDLDHIAAYYRQYRRVMDHWHEVSGLQILDLDYEDLVANQETVSRKIVEFVGLDWNDACLDFHKSKRVTKTASHAQVRKPMYRSSVARYRNYEKYLGPLKKQLPVD